MFREVPKGGLLPGANMQITRNFGCTIPIRTSYTKNYIFHTYSFEELLGITDTILELNSGEQTD